MERVEEKKTAHNAFTKLQKLGISLCRMERMKFTIEMAEAEIEKRKASTPRKRQALTKKWLRRQWKKADTTKSFRAWARKEGKSAVRLATEHYLDGPDLEVERVTGVGMGNGSLRKLNALKKIQEARKARSAQRAAATRAKRRGIRSGGKK